MIRRVAFLVFPDFQMLDLTGPHEVFAQADGLFPAAEPVAASSGLAVGAERTLREALADPEPVDTLVVAGGGGVQQAMRDPETVGFVRAVAATARRTTSVCSGAFLLAQAGLLQGRRAVTHWGP